MLLSSQLSPGSTIQTLVACRQPVDQPSAGLVQTPVDDHHVELFYFEVLLVGRLDQGLSVSSAVSLDDDADLRWHEVVSSVARQDPGGPRQHKATVSGSSRRSASARGPHHVRSDCIAGLRSRYQHLQRQDALVRCRRLEDTVPFGPVRSRRYCSTGGSSSSLSVDLFRKAMSTPPTADVGGASLEAAMCRLVPAATSCVLVIAPRPESLATCLRRSGLSIVAVHPEELSDVVASGNRFSCILLDGLFGVAVERRLHDVRTLLSDGGLLVASVRNPLHHEYLLSLLRSDLPSDSEPAEGVGYATVTRWLFDAGFMPNVADTLPVAAPAGFHRAAQALLRQAGVHPRMARRYLDSSHLIFTASRREMSTNRFASTPLSFVVCVNDELQLTANLLASPALSHRSPHELIVIRGASSIGDAFNDALFRARNAMVVMVHQDVYLPLGWDTQFLSGLEKARRIYDPLGAVGLFGIRSSARIARATAGSSIAIDSWIRRIRCPLASTRWTRSSLPFLGIRRCGWIQRWGSICMARMSASRQGAEA